MLDIQHKNAIFVKHFYFIFADKFFYRTTMLTVKFKITVSKIRLTVFSPDASKC